MSWHQWFEGDLCANGIRIHYRRTGQGDKPPMVLLHGFSDNGLCWLPVAEALETDYDIIMPDARGHGRSEAPEGPYSTSDMADDVKGLVDALNLERPILLGHSMGGMTAFLAAARYPTRFRCILLEDPVLRTPDQERALEEAMAAREEAKGPHRWAEELLKLRELPLEEVMNICRQQNPRWREVEIEPWAISKKELSPNLLRSRFERGEPWWQVFPNITCPILLIVPDVSLGGMTTPEGVQLATRLWHIGEVVNIPGAGHNVRREQFERFMKAVRAFLARHGRD